MTNPLLDLLDFTARLDTVDGMPDGWVCGAMNRAVDMEDWRKLLWVMGRPLVDWVILQHVLNHTIGRRTRFGLSPQAVENYRRYVTDVSMRDAYDTMYTAEVHPTHRVVRSIYAH